MSTRKVDSTKDKKRPALEEAGGIEKKLMTNPNLNLHAMSHSQIAYHSSLEVKDKENPLPACVDKMVQEAPFLKYDTKKNMAANEGGFDIFTRIEKLESLTQKLESQNQKLESLTQKLESQNQKLESQNQKLESHRQSHLDLRQRAISTWVRDAFSKVTERRNEEIRRLNRDIIHGGDVRSDAMVVNERYSRNSTEWKRFSTLYGLTPDNVEDLDQHKCYSSLQALDRAASILLKKAQTNLPNEAIRKEREDLVSLLLEKRYKEAEKMSSNFLCEKESSVAEE
ncbi:uncharacterized protein N7518_002777 [Penicillium psychrosexuale]|uniref:uncharacterized protein n=1 Tax=Penicillium psychrosexuale TaxID=1002107 RepID=UPI0025455E62|nr:uncharacterized protein N7518_002777 [Penicillium psychrosexuale]KAJ5800709.1 hypothetical protein N7518_002777 [Penicillium psychrosexuale]